MADSKSGLKAKLDSLKKRITAGGDEPDEEPAAKKSKTDDKAKDEKTGNGAAKAEAKSGAKNALTPAASNAGEGNKKDGDAKPAEKPKKKGPWIPDMKLIQGLSQQSTAPKAAPDEGMLPSSLPKKKDPLQLAKTPFERLSAFAQMHCMNVPEGATKEWLQNELEKIGIDKTKSEEVMKGNVRVRDKRKLQVPQGAALATPADKKDVKKDDKSSKDKGRDSKEKDKDKARSGGRDRRDDKKEDDKKKRKWKPAFHVTAYEWKKFHPVFAKAGPGGKPQLALGNAAGQIGGAAKPKLTPAKNVLALCWTETGEAKTVKMDPKKLSEGGTATKSTPKALTPGSSAKAGAPAKAPAKATPPAAKAQAGKATPPTAKEASKPPTLKALNPTPTSTPKSASSAQSSKAPPPKGSASSPISASISSKAPPPKGAGIIPKSGLAPGLVGGPSSKAVGLGGTPPPKSAGIISTPGSGLAGQLGALGKASSKATSKGGGATFSKPSEMSGFDLNSSYGARR